jgi:hypothetical protein
MAIDKSALAAAISKHWNAMQQQTVEVPEWGVDGQPALIQFDPLTLAERDELVTYKGNEFMAELIIKKARNADGGNLFTKADKHQLMNAASPAVVSRIANAMLVADTIPVDRLGEP